MTSLNFKKTMIAVLALITWQPDYLAHAQDKPTTAPRPTAPLTSQAPVPQYAPAVNQGSPTGFDKVQSAAPGTAPAQSYEPTQSAAVDPFPAAPSTQAPVASDLESSKSPKEIALIKKLIQDELANGSSQYLEKWRTPPPHLNQAEFQKNYATQGAPNAFGTQPLLSQQLSAPAVRWRARSYFDRERLRDIIGQCEPVIPDLRNALWTATEKFNYPNQSGGKLQAAIDLRNALNSVSETYLSRSGAMNFAPLPHTLEAIYYGSFISGVLLESALSEMETRGPDEIGELAFLGIRQVYGIIFWAAQNLDRNWRTIEDLCFQYDDCFSYRDRLPPVYYNDFRTLAQKFLELIAFDPARPLNIQDISFGKSGSIVRFLKSDRIELRFTQAVISAVVNLIDSSFLRREYWVELEAFANLHDQIDWMLSGTGNQNRNVRRVRGAVKNISDRMIKFECSLFDPQRRPYSDGPYKDGRYPDAAYKNEPPYQYNPTPPGSGGWNPYYPDKR